MMEEIKEDKKLQQLLSSFSCTQDPDIEFFLHNQALEFERLSKSRTYLLLNQDEMLEKDFSELIVYGYISVALKVVTVPETVSNRVRKELDGFGAKIHGAQITNFPFYLIGQLSRNSSVPHESISGVMLLNCANSVISNAVKAVGGRYMMIECKGNEKLIQFYQNNGYTEFNRVTDKDNIMVQMIRKIE